MSRPQKIVDLLATKDHDRCKMIILEEEKLAPTCPRPLSQIIPWLVGEDSVENRVFKKVPTEFRERLAKPNYFKSPDGGFDRQAEEADQRIDKRSPVGDPCVRLLVHLVRLEIHQTNDCELFKFSFSWFLSLVISFFLLTILKQKVITLSTV